MKYSAQDETKLFEHVLSPDIRYSPLNFVLWAFPWGEAGTPLERFPDGPRKWQRETLIAFGEFVKANHDKDAVGLMPEVWRYAMASGRGPGKSALLAWIIQWFQSTNIGGTCIVSANTEGQLKDKTWAELGKWHTLAINGHWFERTALSLKPAKWFDELVRKQLNVDTGYYYASAVLWSEANPDAFAGAHNPLGMMVVFDEASGIPAPIWTVTEGVFTEPVPARYWWAFSNPRRPTGQFYECFHTHNHIWRTRYLDAREVEGTDPATYQSIIDTYGADSDEARVEVYGQFPKQGDRQFISRGVIDEARNRQLPEDPYEPLIMGVDVARFGADSSVIRFRQGRDARSIPPVKLKGVDNITLGDHIGRLAARYNPEVVCIDAGNGTGVIDYCRKVLGLKVHEVWFGSKSPNPAYANLGTHLWAEMRDFLKGGMIDDDADLRRDLAERQYDFTGRTEDIVILEPKERMRARHVPSPDDGDALAVTFAVKPMRRDLRSKRDTRKGRVARDVDYDLFGR